VVSLFKYMCYKEPNSSLEEEDNFDYGF